MLLGKQHLVTNYVINKGEEITINYMSMVEEGIDNKETRQSYLRRWYGFQCACSACTLQVFNYDIKQDKPNLNFRVRNCWMMSLCVRQ